VPRWGSTTSVASHATLYAPTASTSSAESHSDASADAARDHGRGRFHPELGEPGVRLDLRVDIRSRGESAASIGQPGSSALFDPRPEVRHTIDGQQRVWRATGNGRDVLEGMIWSEQ
jgi:hypothetical protein